MKTAKEYSVKTAYIGTGGMITLQEQSTIAVGVIIAESIHTKIPVAIMESKKSEEIKGIMWQV